MITEWLISYQQNTAEYSERALWACGCCSEKIRASEFSVTSTERCLPGYSRVTSQRSHGKFLGLASLFCFTKSSEINNENSVHSNQCSVKTPSLIFLLYFNIILEAYLKMNHISSYSLEYSTGYFYRLGSPL